MTPLDPQTHAPERRRPVGPYARWFEDFSVGDRIITQGRTVTEVDGSMWSMLTGDLHPLHVDEEAAAAYGLFGARFPAGLLSVALASGLKERLGLFHGTSTAVLEQTVRYRRPVLFGDTIRVEMRVAALEPKPRLGGGVLTLAYEIRKDEDTVCAEGELVLLMALRPGDGAAPTYGMAAT